jgi:UPF0042 nucleotide-binding protein
MLTGMSGAGKTTALRFLEDMGYFCVDNLPWQLLDAFVELCQASSMRRVAIGVDSRGGSLFDAQRVIEAMHSMGRESGMTIELAYMDCAEEALIARYKETRRDHPMAKDRSLQSGIALERELLLPLKEAATHIIDTTALSVRQLRQTITQLFQEEEASRSLRVEVVSFGFKRGLPRDADMVFDVRFLPNPFYEASLRRLTGRETAVRDYVLDKPETQKFLEQVTDLLLSLLPQFIQEGKNRLMIAVGCTGGMHRSVALADEIGRRIRAEGYRVDVAHRDLEQERARYTME